MFATCLVCKKEISGIRGGKGNKNRVKYCSIECLRSAHRGGAKTLSKEWGVSSTGVGAITELLVSVDLMKRGYDVFRALSLGTCDLVAIKNGKCLRVEVKSGYVHVNGDINHTSIKDDSAYDILAIATKDSIHYKPNLE